MLGPNHGWGISNRVQQMSKDGLKTSQGSPGAVPVHEVAWKKLAALAVNAMSVYCERSDVMGSIRIARRAGTRLAIATTSMSKPTTLPNTTGSRGPTP